MINNDTIKERNDVDIDYNDEYLSMILGILRDPDNAPHNATVKKRSIGKDGTPIGKSNTNLHIDSRMYDIEFLDGSLATKYIRTKIWKNGTDKKCRLVENMMKPYITSCQAVKCLQKISTNLDMTKLVSTYTG